MGIRLLGLAVLASLFAAPPHAQGALCGADADALGTLLRTDYAGRDLLRGPEGAGRSEALASFLARAHEAPDAVACDTLLHAATALFPDGHLHVNAETPSQRVRVGDRRFSPWSGELEVRHIGDQAVVVRVRSFDLGNKPAIDSLIAANAERIAATPYLIIDVTSNGGGGDSAFESLLPFLYTDPIRVPGAEIAATPGNRSDLADYLEGGHPDDETRTFLESLLRRIDAAEPGSFVSFGDDGAFDVVLDTVYALPRAVAVLTDAGTASSAEEFVLSARQSSKVIVVGTSTYGALDYSNLRSVELPSGNRSVDLSMTRRAWLPDVSVDASGIAPDTLVPEGAADWAVFALGVLVGRDRESTR